MAVNLVAHPISVNSKGGKRLALKVFHSSPALPLFKLRQTGFAQTEEIVGTVAGFPADDEVVEHTAFFY